MRKNIWYTF